MYRTSTSGSEISSILAAVNGIVRKLTRCADDADDITQEIMIKLLASAAVPREIRPGWLFKVAQNCVIDSRRQAARENKYLNRYLYVDTCGAVCESSEDERAVYFPNVSDRHQEVESDVWPMLMNVVLNLSEPLREALLMWADGYTYEEIGCATKANIGTVRSRLHYARKRARLLLREIA